MKGNQNAYQFKMKILLRTIFIASIICFAGCSTKPYALNYPEDAPKEGKTPVYIINHGRHTGFALPSKQIVRQLPVLQQRFGNVPYYEFGWGDHDFYLADEITLWLKFQAILWPTNTVMHVVAVPKPPKKYFLDSEVIEFYLNDSQFSNLRKFLISSFYQDKTGNIVPLKKGIYGDSIFFKGTGDYHLFNTCNKWTAKGLQSTGMDISPTFKLTADSIMDYFKTNKQTFKSTQ
jgi:uncharacterized protein (TIGR02117 family)